MNERRRGSTRKSGNDARIPRTCSHHSQLITMGLVSIQDNQSRQNWGKYICRHWVFFARLVDLPPSLKLWANRHPPNRPPPPLLDWPMYRPAWALGQLGAPNKKPSVAGYWSVSPPACALGRLLAPDQTLRIFYWSICRLARAWSQKGGAESNSAFDKGASNHRDVQRGVSAGNTRRWLVGPRAPPPQRGTNPAQ